MAGGGLPTPHQRQLRNDAIKNAPGPDPLKGAVMGAGGGAIAGAAKAATKPFTDVTKFVGELFSASLWERIGLIVLGTLLVILGIVFLLHKSIPAIPIPEVPVP